MSRIRIRCRVARLQRFGAAGVLVLALGACGEKGRAHDGGGTTDGSAVDGAPWTGPPEVWRSVQWGTPSEDGANALAVDELGVTVAGYTMAPDSPGQAEELDILVTRLSLEGEILWSRQFGSPSWDQAYAVAADRHGNIFVAGGTMGDLGGQLQAGQGDIFLVKMDLAGEIAWTRLWGTGEEDMAFAMAIDGDQAIYLAGWTAGNLAGSNAGNTDNFLMRVSLDGEQVWVRQWGSDGFDEPDGVAVDPINGDVLVAGTAGGALNGTPVVGKRDQFLTRYSAEGEHRWTRVWGTAGLDFGKSVAVDARGDAYVSGYFSGDSQTNISEAALTKFDRGGNELWRRSWGSPDGDNGWSVTAYPAGGVLVAGFTMGRMGADPYGGGDCGEFPCIDVFLTGYDADGGSSWTRQWGCAGDDWGLAVRAEEGTVFVAGRAVCAMEGATAFGDVDAFLSILRFASQ